MTLLDKDFHDDLDLDEDEDDMDSDSLGDFAYALNPEHFIRFERRGPQLLVVFEPVHDRTQPLEERRVRLDALAREQDWSVLSLLSQGHTWFRAPEVVTFFDALVDGTLLDQFDEVLFYGASSGGHAALSYALTAPMSRVLALAPQATLDPAKAPWDTRFRAAAGLEFGDRYLPTSENLAVAETVYLLHDPMVEEDARHAALLKGLTTLPLVCRHMGSLLEETLIEFGVLDDIVLEAMSGTLDAPVFYTALRARRDNPGYLRKIVGRLIEDERLLLEALVVRNVAERTGRNRYAKRFEKLRETLAARGQHVPPSRRG